MDHVQRVGKFLTFDDQEIHLRSLTLYPKINWMRREGKPQNSVSSVSSSIYLSSISYFWREIPDRGNWRGEVIHLAFQFKKGGGTSVRGTAPTVSKLTEKSAGTQLAFFFVSFYCRTSAQVWWYPHSEWVFSPQLSLSGNTLVDTGCLLADSI